MLRTVPRGEVAPYGLSRYEVHGFPHGKRGLCLILPIFVWRRKGYHLMWDTTSHGWWLSVFYLRIEREWGCTVRFGISSVALGKHETKAMRL